MLVTHWLTDWLTDSCLVYFIDVTCDSWRCQLKTCWGCYCCLCTCWETCWRQFYADLVLAKLNSTLGSVVPLAMFLLQLPPPSTYLVGTGHCATIASFKVSTLYVLCSYLDSARPDECTLSLCTASPQRTCGTLSDQFFWCQVLAVFCSSQKTAQPLCSFSIYAIVRFATNSHMGLKHASREKKLPMVNFLIFVHKKCI